MRRREGIACACIAALSLCALAVCAPNPSGLPCAEKDKACVWRALMAHPVRNADFWKADRARPLAERIAPAPPKLIQFVALGNVQNGFPDRPTAADPDRAFMQDVRAAFAGLPVEVRRLFHERLVGIYLVDKLGSTGFTDAVLDDKGSQVAGMIVLDAGVLKYHTANGWATWKENTPFKRDERVKLHARIENDADDNRMAAIQYLLLHELGHVLSIGGNIHPPWNREVKATLSAATYPFFDLSWKIDKATHKYVSRFDDEFTLRRDVAYYFGAKLGTDDMVPVYASLEKTNFPSLYAATHPGDDFAEAFASYVHVVLQKRPWEITISRDGQVVKTFKSCWDEARCAAKRKLLEQLIKP